MYPQGLHPPISKPNISSSHISDRSQLARRPLPRLQRSEQRSTTGACESLFSSTFNFNACIYQAAIAAENQAIARGDSRGANLLVVPAGSSTATVPAASRNGGYALAGAGGARGIGFGAGVAQGARAGLGSNGAVATWGAGLGAGGAGYGAGGAGSGAGGAGYGAGGAGSGAGGAGSGAGGAGYGAAGLGYGAGGAGSDGYGLTGTLVSFPNGAVVPAVVAARANHIAAVAAARV